MICDRQTDGQTDRRPGKNNMSPDPEGGDMITPKLLATDGLLACFA